MRPAVLRFVCALAAVAAGLFALSLAGPVQAQVLLLTSEEGPAYREAAQAFTARLAAHTAEPVLLLASDDPRALGALRGEAKLAIAIGTRAMQLAAREAAVPTLSILVPRQTFEAVSRESGRRDPRTWSVIYLDQPFRRQLQLIRLAVPTRDHVVVLVGPESRERLPALRQAAAELKLRLQVEEVAAEREIVPALNRMLAGDVVLLVVPDPLVYNRNTIQSVLITSYRAGDPLIAHSKAYVTAGALAAVYSTPAQFGEQAADIALRVLRGQGMAPAQYPKYFSVSVNMQVARSLGLTIDDEATLLEHLRNGTEQD